MSRLHQRSKSGTSADVESDAEPDPPTRSILPHPNLVPLRKKGMGVKPWLLLDSNGQAQVVEVGKHAIMRRTGLPARDLRILDPVLSYPSTVLSRERAIVINLEHIKAIITAQEVLLLNSRDPSVIPFIDELREKLGRHSQASKAMKAQESGNDGEGWTQLTSVGASEDEGGEASGKKGHPEKSGNEMKVLPFEFAALEVCLEFGCTGLQNEARAVELEACQVSDKLILTLSKLNTERLRNIKSRLASITGRVQKVKDSLEHLLDDDVHMDKMCLTENSQLQNYTSSSWSKGDDMNDEAPLPPQTVVDDTHCSNLGEISPDAIEESMNFEGDICNFDNPSHKSQDIHHKHTSTRSSTSSVKTSKNLDVDELEMLLEAYFVQIDATLKKLFTAREYIDDTEDYINIMLDEKQNQLLKMGIMLTTVTFIVGAFSQVTGVFSMQIHIDLFDDTKAGMNEFLWTVGVSTMASVVLYIISIKWFKKKRLLL